MKTFKTEKVFCSDDTYITIITCNDKILIASKSQKTVDDALAYLEGRDIGNCLSRDIRYVLYDYKDELKHSDGLSKTCENCTFCTEAPTFVIKEDINGRFESLTEYHLVCFHTDIARDKAFKEVQKHNSCKNCRIGCRRPINRINWEE